MYLSKVKISGFRGIANGVFTFSPGVNVIIGENASNKSTLIDSIRLLYCLGNPQRDIWISEDDFYYDVKENLVCEKISFEYEFSDLTLLQKGAMYEYLILGEDESKDVARLTLEYEFHDNNIVIKYYSGKDVEQKPSSETFNLFRHYYLDPLRDSTLMLLGSKKNILSQLLNRTVKKNNTKEDYEEIIINANRDVMSRGEIKSAKSGINKNLQQIFRETKSNHVGLRIDSSKIEFIMNTIKPYLPHNIDLDDSPGFQLKQNSLGFNNLIYIAVVLGDIRESRISEKLSHFALLIEEPEAHLHPQLQLNLYRFLRENTSKNTQLFVTTHSPSLTSKVPLSSLNLINDEGDFWNLSNCFSGRSKEGIKQNGKTLSSVNFQIEKRKLERYLDVTKSQLFFSKAVVLVEGISEKLLLGSLTKRLGFFLEDFQIEIVNVSGTSFYPFLHLFNSKNKTKKLPQRVLVLSDDDRFSDSKNKKFSFNKIIRDDKILDELCDKLQLSPQNQRMSNLQSIRNGQSEIILKFSMKTFEFDLVYSNVFPIKKLFFQNAFIQYLKIHALTKHNQLVVYANKLYESKSILEKDDRLKLACLTWKALGSKATFAQDFSAYLDEFDGNFIVPRYIRKGLKRLTQNL